VEHSNKATRALPNRKERTRGPGQMSGCLGRQSLPKARGARVLPGKKYRSRCCHCCVEVLQRSIERLSPVYRDQFSPRSREISLVNVVRRIVSR